MERWLLDRYAASAFNVCTHQIMNKISGPPLKITVDPKVPQVARHVLSQIPWHFREQLKKGLDADCRMEVLEEAAPNTPVDYMAPLLITPKKNRTPRRTVD